MPDELQVAAHGRADHPTSRLHVAGQLRPGRPGLQPGCGVVAALHVDRLRQVVRDARDHLRELDRCRRVVDEVDQDGQVRDHEGQRHRDADVRHEHPARARPDRDQNEHVVHERRHEGAEGQLRAAISDEVPQHPRTELSGRQGKGNQDDREHNADHRDDGGGKRGEDLSGSVS